MLIGFDGSRAFSKTRTGTENYSYQLLKALSGIDKKNKYLVYLRLGNEVKVSQWPKNFQFSILNFKFLWTQVGLSLQTFKDKMDVLFVPAHTLPLIRKPGLKTVVTVHDLGSEYLPQMHQFKQRLYLSFMQRYQLKGATKIIAVSNATKEDLIKKIGINPGKVEVVYEGHDKDKFKSDILVESLKQYYLFVGTIQPRKNIERIIEAAYRIKQKLVIAGSKGWGRKLKVVGNVEFLGYVPDKKLAKLYKGAIALLFPSLFEGFGLPILEAQACGCPVITSNISSMPEVAGKGAIYVNPYNLDDIVRGMIKINNQDTRNKLIKLGFENIKRFSWEKCARETLKVLEDL
ncbi:MAG: Uncharacterized protein G01um10147_888 [Microgenomates group bacterium Gr01-1014_7]|nr:MAG: Uncharacterized protein G01um10147_888 [Microgenomates group bacterium Gr01-1014_7]